MIGKRLKAVLFTLALALSVTVGWVLYCGDFHGLPSYPHGAAHMNVARPVRQEAKDFYYQYGFYPRMDDAFKEHRVELLSGQPIRPVEGYKNLYAYVIMWSFKDWTKRLICGCKVSTARPPRYFGFFYRGRKKPPLVMAASDPGEDRPSQEAWGKVVRYVEEGDEEALGDLIRFDGLDPDRDSRLWRWAVRRAGEKRIESVVPALLDNLEKRFANNDYHVDYYMERLIEALVQIRGEGREIRSEMRREEKKDVVKWWLQRKR